MDAVVIIEDILVRSLLLMLSCVRFTVIDSLLSFSVEIGLAIANARTIITNAV